MPAFCLIHNFPTSRINFIGAQQQFPPYIPPSNLEQLYDDWMHDRSVAWLDVAPDDWFDYIDRLNLFGR